MWPSNWRKFQLKRIVQLQKDEFICRRLTLNIDIESMCLQNAFNLFILLIKYSLVKRIAMQLIPSLFYLILIHYFSLDAWIYSYARSTQRERREKLRVVHVSLSRLDIGLYQLLILLAIFLFSGLIFFWQIGEHKICNYWCLILQDYGEESECLHRVQDFTNQRVFIEFRNMWNPTELWELISSGSIVIAC